MKINKEQIKSFIKQIPEKTWQGIKNIYELPHSGKYFFLSIVLIIFFLFLTFPYGSLILKRIYALEGEKTFKSINLPVFKFSIIGKTEIENPAIILNNGNEIFGRKISIANPNPISLLLSKKIKSNFSVNQLKYAWKESELLITFHQGNMELSLDKTYTPTSGSLQIEAIDITLRGITIPIPTQLGPMLLKFDQKNVEIKSVDCKITNGVLKFDKIESSKDIVAEISGTISLINKRLDLTIYIDTDIQELEVYKSSLTRYIKNDRLGIQIRGTLDNPESTLIE